MRRLIDSFLKLFSREMKDEKAADILRKKTITKERNIAMAEKARLEEMATRVRFLFDHRCRMECFTDSLVLSHLVAIR
jgi:hypothetical protein